MELNTLEQTLEATWTNSPVHHASIFLPLCPSIHFDSGCVNWSPARLTADGVFHLQEALPSNRLNVAEEFAVLVAVPWWEDGELHKVAMMTSGIIRSS